LFEVHVAPSAKEDSVRVSDGILRVRTTEPPDKGKANKAVAKLLKPFFGPCRVVSGLTSKKKTVLAENLAFDGFCAVLRRLGEGLG
jgi:uncharacterized protein (TIGR00251 family)